jgi:hypothetical protein
MQQVYTKSALFKEEEKNESKKAKVAEKSRYLPE